MANYFIIGGDDKVYGPISETEVRQWIAESRLSRESRAKAESDAEFRSLAQFPEFAAELNQQATATGVSPAESSANFLERDYELDIGGCISRGYGLFKDNFGILVIACLVMAAAIFGFPMALGFVIAPLSKHLLHLPTMVQVGFNYLLPVVTSLVIGPAAGGVYLTVLKKIRKEPASVGNLFAGFQNNFWPLYFGSLVPALIIGLCLLPCQYVWQAKTAPLIEQMQHLQNDPAGMQNLMPQFMLAFTNSLPVVFVCLVPVTFFTVTWQFTVPLIIDKKMDVTTAMKASWNLVMKHWWHVFGLTVLAGLVSFAGALVCCVGGLFTAPIGIAALMFGYETIFGAEKN